MTSLLNIVFMGTPDFAVPSLEALVENGHQVSMVVTQPDRPRGRGRKPMAPPVKTAAMAAGIEVVQPESLKNEAFGRKIAQLAPDLIVTVAFGHILGKEILAVPRLGAVNVHASILPRYRGPAPIHWAIINGEAETGVTTMMMDPGLDTGDILLSARAPIGLRDTAADLHDRLAAMGADLLTKTLARLDPPTIIPEPQDHGRATHAPLLKKSDGRMDWRRPATALDAFVRGMTPWPGAFTFNGKQRLKIWAAEPVDAPADAEPGTVVRGFADELRVATGSGLLNILEIQGASGKRMPVKNFLMGAKMPPGTRLA